MNEFNAQPSSESHVMRRSFQAAGALAVATSFLLAPSLALADETSGPTQGALTMPEQSNSDTPTVTIDIQPSASPSEFPKDDGGLEALFAPIPSPNPDIGINDDGMYPTAEPSPTEQPDISINDDGLYPIQPETVDTLPATGSPITPALITGLGMVGAGVSLIAASKRR